MNKGIIIARWEFMERIKRKSFLISMFLVPIIIVGISMLPSFLIVQGEDSPIAIGIVDFTKKYEKEFSVELTKNYLQNGQPAFFAFTLAARGIGKTSLLEYADKQVLSDAIFGYLIIQQESDLKLIFRSKDIFNPEKLNMIENSFNRAVVNIITKEIGLSHKDVESISSSITTIKKSYIDADTEEDLFNSFINSYLFIILLITLILFSGGMFVRSLVLEKSNRIIELILSSCTSKELLMGKVLGLSFFGLFQLLAWMIIGILLHKTNTIDLSLIKNLHYQLLFFVLGYIFYSSIFIGLGSIVNADQEAQQLTGLITIFLIFPVLLAVEIIRAPDSIFSIILSYFPLTSVPVMLLRLNSTSPQIIEVLTVILVLIFNIYIVILISSKIFRIGILMSGHRPKIKEIISWLKLK